MSRRLASLLTQWVPDAVQFIPGLLEGSEERMVLQVTRHLKCLDRDRTKFYVNGQGKTEVATPAIDPARAAGNHIFRVQEDPRAFDVIVSHWLREKFEQSKVTGAYFTPLPGDYDSVR